MGMDVIGMRPLNETGEHFRNNIWWWGPLWEYCNIVAPQLCGSCHGWTNDGDGLPEGRALALSDLLEQSITDGRCARHQAELEDKRQHTPKVMCTLCDGSGIRKDAVGMDNGMVEQELDFESAAELGRERGWCNGCDGRGSRESSDTWYHFDVENVRHFVSFLRNCGGFNIW
jgi:hypothetical protein